MKTALVIGGGPAGLMAAEVMSNAGISVTIADAMPTLGRKFLMAGKSGLNLTKDEPLETLQVAYGAVHPTLTSAVNVFGPDAVKAWAMELKQELYTGSTKRVFPTAMKASPLLREWLSRLGARTLTRHRWTGWSDKGAIFDTPTGPTEVEADAYVLALGGASWARLGSDGAWAQHFPNETVPFAPANVGLSVDWSPHMAKHFGQPVKGTRLTVGDSTSRGEWIVSENGVEGGGIYSISRAARDGTDVMIDLLPEWDTGRIAQALNRPRGKSSLTNFLRKALKLDAVKLGLLSEFGRPFPEDLAPLIKALPLQHQGPRPIDQAISTAGGLRFEALSDQLMLNARPGVFCAGEMLDWEAPTGGYLLTACFATGHLAGQGVVDFLNKN